MAKYATDRVMIGAPDVVDAAIGRGDVTRARESFCAFHDQQVAMVDSYFEWIAAWQRLVALRSGVSTAHELRTVRRRWTHLAGTYASRPLLRKIGRHLHRRPITSSSLRVIDSRRKHAAAAIASPSRQGARQAFRGYVATVRTVHDTLVDYVALLAAHVSSSAGVDIGGQEALQSLSSCSYYTPAWEQFLSLPPAQLAAAIVEEFQTHLSGPDRQGSVTLREYDGSYRILLDACGSGGAMRRRIAALGLTQLTIPTASPITWSDANTVPAYCSHCAQNELTALARSGRLLWATEFNPDPQQPCAWVVFKHADAIPKRYYERLGVSQPPRR